MAVNRLVRNSSDWSDSAGMERSDKVRRDTSLTGQVGKGMAGKERTEEVGTGSAWQAWRGRDMSVLERRGEVLRVKAGTASESIA